MRKKRKQAGTYTPTNNHEKATKMQREEGWPLFVSKNTQTHTRKKKGWLESLMRCNSYVVNDKENKRVIEAGLLWV
jgi:hypothetical protein